MTDTAEPKATAPDYLAKAKRDHASAIAALKTTHGERVKNLTADHAAQIEKLKTSHAATVAKLKAQITAEPKAARAEPSRDKGRAASALQIDEADTRSPAERSAALFEAIRDAEKVEILFSDGTREIDGINALTVSGDAWKVSPAGVMLNLPAQTLIYGPAQGQAAFSLDGYGLLLDGKLAAYAKRPEPLNIGAGQQIDVSQDVAFAG